MPQTFCFDKKGTQFAKGICKTLFHKILKWVFFLVFLYDGMYAIMCLINVDKSRSKRHATNLP